MLKYENGEFVHPIHGSVSKQTLIDEIRSMDTTLFYKKWGAMRPYLSLFCRMGILDPSSHLSLPHSSSKSSPKPSRAHCKHILKWILLERGVSDDYFSTLERRDNATGEDVVTRAIISSIFLLFELYPQMVLTTIQHAVRTLDDRYIADHLLPNKILEPLYARPRQKELTARVITKTYRRWYRSNVPMALRIADAIIPHRALPENIIRAPVSAVIERIRRLEMLGFSVFTERVLCFITRNIVTLIREIAPFYSDRQRIYKLEDNSEGKLDDETPPSMPAAKMWLELYDHVLQRAFLQGITLEGVMGSASVILLGSHPVYKTRFASRCSCVFSEETVFISGMLVTKEVKRRTSPTTVCQECEFYEALSGGYTRYKQRLSRRYTLFDLLSRFLY